MSLGQVHLFSEFVHNKHLLQSFRISSYPTLNILSNETKHILNITYGNFKPSVSKFDEKEYSDVPIQNVIVTIKLSIMLAVSEKSHVNSVAHSSGGSSSNVLTNNVGALLSSSSTLHQNPPQPAPSIPPPAPSPLNSSPPTDSVQTPGTLPVSLPTTPSLTPQSPNTSPPQPATANSNSIAAVSSQASANEPKLLMNGPASAGNADLLKVGSVFKSHVSHSMPSLTLACD